MAETVGIPTVSLFALGQFWAKLLIDEIALLRISWYNNFEHEMAVTMPDSVYYF